MMRRLALTTLLASLFTTGCATKAAYVINPLHTESVPGKLDARWYQRDVYDTNGGLEAIELIYCPKQPDEKLVCRSGVIWRAGQSDLVDLMADAASKNAVVPLSK